VQPQHVVPRGAHAGQRAEPERHVRREAHVRVELLLRDGLAAVLAHHDGHVAVVGDEAAVEVVAVAEVDVLRQLHEPPVSQGRQEVLAQALLSLVQIAEVAAPVDQHRPVGDGLPQRGCRARWRGRGLPWT
jgi:hypothetical protein